jgi:molybdate transport system substrate-binding protein
MRRFVAGLLIAVAYASSGIAGGPREVLTVSAAISLTNVLEQIGKVFQSATGTEVRFNFAGSNVLARQIIDGAPADVFVSADEAQMRLVESAGAVAAETKVDLLGNRLAVVVSRETPPISDVKDLVRPAVKRIALADPEAVPAGVYARQYLQTVGLWDQLRPKTVPVANVRAALTSADNGSVQAAFVYESDVTAASSVTLALVISDPRAPRIVYPAAVTMASRNAAAARQFVTFLRGRVASDLFRKYKFIPLAERAE